MSLKVSFVFAVLVAGMALIALSDGFFMKPSCPQYEKYKVCGSSCPKTCATLLTPTFCGFTCVSGCFCIPGFFRNRNQTCVAATSCSQ